MDNPYLDLEYWTSGRDTETAEFASVVSEIWVCGLPLSDRLDMALKVITEYPSTLLFSNLVISLQVEAPDQQVLWERLFQFYADSLISADAHLQVTAETSLYVDLFEAPQIGPTAWRFLSAKLQENPEALTIVLRNSGPLSWSLKFPLLLRFAKDKRYALAIYQAIRHALFDESGQVDEEQANDLFADLDLTPYMERIMNPPGYPSLQDVEDRLGEENA